MVVMILTIGCETLKQVGNELQDCMQICFSACNVLKENKFDLQGYTFGLEKKSRQTTLSCQCAC